VILLIAPTDKKQAVTEKKGVKTTEALLNAIDEDTIGKNFSGLTSELD
jgi:hypothetical protein